MNPDLLPPSPDSVSYKAERPPLPARVISKAAPFERDGKLAGVWLPHPLWGTFSGTAKEWLGSACLDVPAQSVPFSQNTGFISATELQYVTALRSHDHRFL